MVVSGLLQYYDQRIDLGQVDTSRMAPTDVIEAMLEKKGERDLCLPWCRVQHGTEGCIAYLRAVDCQCEIRQQDWKTV